MQAPYGGRMLLTVETRKGYRICRLAPFHVFSRSTNFWIFPAKVLSFSV
jgi:hypothetical protein